MTENTLKLVTERAALLVGNASIEPGWAELDATGTPPQVLNNYELVTLPDAAVAIYRHPRLERPRYAILEELVAISAGIAPTEEAHREQMEALRERTERAEKETEIRAQRLAAASVRAAMSRAEKAEAEVVEARAVEQKFVDASRDLATDLAEARHRMGKILEQARRWKRVAVAAELEAEGLHGEITVAEGAARLAIRDRDALEAKLDRSLNDARRAHGLRREAQAKALAAEERITEAQASALEVVGKIARLIPVPDAAEHPGFEISTFYGSDNVPVVQIDSEGVEGRLRINLNDAPIWDGDPETDERPGANLLETDVREIRGATIIGATVTQDSNGRGFISVEAEIDDVREVELPAVGESAFPAPRQNMKTTISRQIEAIRDRDARIEELEDERTEARNELSATRRELDSTAESLRLSEQHFENAVTLSEQRQERVEELLAERDELQAERDTLATDRDAADHMRKRLDERLADVTRAGAITAAGLRSMIRQRDELLRSASRLFTSHLGAPFSSDDLDEGLRIANAHGNLAKLDDEPTSRADESVLDLVRVAGKVVRFWRAAPTSVITEQLNIALAELANLTKR